MITKYIVRDCFEKKNDYYDKNRADLSYYYKKPAYGNKGWRDVITDCFCGKATRNLRNKNGQFSVIITDVETALKLVTKCWSRGLTVEGDGSAFRKELRIKRLKKGDFITFADPNSARFDINFVRDPKYIKKNNLVPIYELEEDWNRITSAVKELVDEKAKLVKLAGYPQEPTYAMLKGTAKFKKDKTRRSFKAVVSDTWIWTECGNYLIPKYQNDRVVFNFC